MSFRYTCSHCDSSYKLKDSMEGKLGACPVCKGRVVAKPVAKQTQSNGIAVALNFFFPGLGQIIQGRVGTGIAFFVASIIGTLLFVLPGICVWMYAMYEANTYDPQNPPQRAVRFKAIALGTLAGIAGLIILCFIL